MDVCLAEVRITIGILQCEQSRHIGLPNLIGSGKEETSYVLAARVCKGTWEQR